MLDGTRLVFGISPGIRDDDMHHAFVDVLGEVVGGVVAPVTEPKTEFPNVGNFYLSDEYWIPPRGVGALWRVRSTRTVEPGARAVEYAAVEPGKSLPLEIIAIPASSSDPDDIHHTVVDGFTLGYEPANSVLLQLSDGAIVGPVRRDPLFETGFRCKPDALIDVLGVWPKRETLRPLSFLTIGGHRTFVSILQLPAATSFIDCSAMEYAVKSLLRLSRDAHGGGSPLTKRQIDDLSHQVAELSVPRRLECRVARVRSALEHGRLSQGALRAFAEYVASAPAIVEELSVLKEEVRKAERERFADENSKEVQSVAKLRRAKNDLEDDLSRLQAQIADAEAEFSRTIDQLTEKLGSRIEKARSEPAALLADVALIRPFLNFVPSGKPASSRRDPMLIPTSHCEDVGAPMDLLNLLEQRLAAAAVGPRSAKCVAREVLAAAQACQLVTFDGSLAHTLARACAGAFAARSTRIYSVPIGLLDGEEFSAFFADALAQSQAGDVVTAIVLEGINRSALDAYADTLTSAVANHQLAPNLAHPGVVLFATLARGPSALSLAAVHCELGPTLDTDALTMTSRLRSEPKAGIVQRSQWQGWCAQTTPLDGLPGSAEDLADRMQGERSLLWQRTVLNAFGRLSAIKDNKASSTPLESLIFGWLLPRAYSSDLPRAHFEEKLNAVMSESENRDSRIERVLRRLFPWEEPRPI